MKYRPQRGGYEESMAEVVEVDSYADLRRHLQCKPKDMLHVAVGGYGGVDSRNGWDTHVVFFNGWVIGFTDGAL